MISRACKRWRASVPGASNGDCERQIEILLLSRCKYRSAGGQGFRVEKGERVSDGRDCAHDAQAGMHVDEHTCPGVVACQVKARRLRQVRNLGAPVELAGRYFAEGADEVAFLNITGFRDFPLGDLPMLEVIDGAAAVGLSHLVELSLLRLCPP